MKQKRTPIVTVLGHVDHGKTTLLDVIRSSNIAGAEAGGITQSIGASLIKTKFGDITFLDTPGHAAFSSMRNQGVLVCDIAILVVASDDGPMPQTKEAIELITKSKTPFVVALTKSDLPSANPEKVKSQLESLGIALEGRGGQVPCVEISSKNKTNIDTLLETISLLSEVIDISSDPEDELEAYVIEAKKQPQGIYASVIVKNGTLKEKSDVYCNQTPVRVRGLFDETQKRILEVPSGKACFLLGFTFLPEVGSLISGSSVSKSKSHTENTYGPIGKSDEKIRLLLKTSSLGSLKALITALPSEIYIHRASVGDLVEEDVFLAKNANARILIFESKAPSSVAKLAEAEGVKIDSFNVIYKLIEFVEELIKSGQTAILGQAQVLAIFPFDNKKVAGIKVLSGKILVKSKVVVLRGASEIGTSKVTSLRKMKDEISEAKAGVECGALLEPQFPLEKGDLLIAI